MLFAHVAHTCLQSPAPPNPSRPSRHTPYRIHNTPHTYILVHTRVIHQSPISLLLTHQTPLHSTSLYSTPLHSQPIPSNKSPIHYTTRKLNTTILHDNTTATNTSAHMRQFTLTITTKPRKISSYPYQVRASTTTNQNDPDRI